MLSRLVRAVAVCSCVSLAVPIASAQNYVIDFEHQCNGAIFPAGMRVSPVCGRNTAGGSVSGQIGVHGTNPGHLVSQNTAIIFDSSHPTGNDPDLGTPNENFGGPGVGRLGGLPGLCRLGWLILNQRLDLAHR